ncbi:hypothetical protein EPO33_05040 [Patescibacteria group bacterium]|nr:MAG: hypothetical protein EPO33_05040 [Patescibacteria group bacterium]
MRYLFGILGIVLGMILVIKSEWFFTFFGRIDFADKYLGTEGGTRLMYKLIGILFVLLSLLYMTGGIESFLKAVFIPGGV